MYKHGWLIATDANYAAGMVRVARKCVEELEAIVVGSESLAAEVASFGVDSVSHFEVAGAVPPEAAAKSISQKAEAEKPELVISNEAPSARVLMGCAAGACGATVLSEVVDIEAPDEGACEVERSAASGIAIEKLTVKGPIAVVFGGADAEEPASSGVLVDKVELDPLEMEVVDELLPAAGAVDLSEATRIVGLGRGVRKKDDLEDIERLANALGATLACTLPLCDDSKWFPAERVLGSSHNQAAPELYIALGISGSPNHVSGVKNAKVIVAVNNDPEAAIFQRCDYGIVGDLYDFVPALEAALAGE